jgi:uncharacterized protein
MNIFVDTSAFLAVLNENDLYHPQAKQTWADLLSDASILYSSNYIMLETSALLQHRFDMEAVRLFENSFNNLESLFLLNKQSAIH